MAREQSQAREDSQAQEKSPAQQAWEGVKNYLKENAQEVAEGAKDLWNGVIPAFPGNQSPVDELGTPLSPTQITVNRELGSVHDIDKVMDGYANRGNHGHGQEQDRGIER
jgi:hypothetical protein